MSTKVKSTALVIFAREPKLGKVKTRLAKGLSKDHSFKLYKAFVKDVIAVGKGVKCDKKYIFYHGHSAHIPFLKREAKGFTLKRQFGSNLGERMLRAFRFCEAEGAKHTIIIGTDCLTFNAKDVNQAFAHLAKKDYVLGPSKDGGYYLIGANHIDPKVFKGVKWSSSQVLAQTKSRIAQMSQSTRLLKIREDIDDIDSFRRFMRQVRRTKKPAHVYQTAKKLDLLKV